MDTNERRIMNTLRHHRGASTTRLAGRCFAIAAVLLVQAAAPAQRLAPLGQRRAHYLFNARQPVGEIGRAQLQRRPELHGFFQPVRIKVPRGALVAVAEGGAFATADLDVALVGLQVGEVYRLKVSQIPNRGLAAIYPTIELLDRMHPPPGKETRYPIPIEIAPEDLALALAGKYVTRVIYVEDPRDAIPARDLPEQRYFEVLPSEDPLVVAGELGRPVAILRMGTVAPGPAGPTSEFLFGSPPIVRHAAFPTVDYVPSEHQVRPPQQPSPAADAIDQPDPEEVEEVSESDRPTADATPPARPEEPAFDEDIFGEDIGDFPDVDDQTNPFQEQ